MEVARWARVSACLAPVFLIGGFLLGALRQPPEFDSTIDTISALAALGARDRWIMTAGLVGLGACHVSTASGLRAAAPLGRIVLAIGGVFTFLVACFPLRAGDPNTSHLVVASVAFFCLAAWAPLARSHEPEAPAALRPSIAYAAGASLFALIAWFAITLFTKAHNLGLAERLTASAQSLWPLAVVWSDTEPRNRG